MSTILGYHYRASTQLMYQRFENRLDDEPQVKTLIRRSLSDMFGPFGYIKIVTIMLISMVTMTGKILLV